MNGVPLPVALLVCCLLAFPGCDSLGPEGELDLFVSANPELASVGDTLILTATLRNTGNDATEAVTNDGCPFTLSVLSADGDLLLATPGAGGCVDAVTHWNLQPGESLERSLNWVSGRSGEYRFEVVLDGRPPLGAVAPFTIR